MEDTLCPLCGGPMLSRKNGKTGRRFWGCRDFPACRGTRDTDGEAPGYQRRDEAAGDDSLPSERARRNDRRRWE